VRDVCAGGAPQDAPWIVFTAGAMGAGKSHVVNWMSSEGHFPLPNIVQIDPDAFRSRLPEWGTYLSRDPLMAGRLTHRECGYCVELAQESALQQRKHIWVDGSLRNSEWYRQVFADIRARHPCYRIAILHIHASEAAVMDRVRARALLTGRYVPEEELTRSLRDVPAAVEALTSSVDFYAKIANEPGESPKLLKFCNETLCRVMESGDEWSQVSSRFGLESSEDQVRATRQSIEVLVSRHDVFLISKSYCSFCQTAKSRLACAEICFEALDIDTLPQGVLIQTEAARMTGSRTTPMVFVRGRFVGGCNETVGLIQTGKLRAMLDGIPKLAE
jgi:glutaredoxin/predicted ABC-type ATPase